MVRIFALAAAVGVLNWLPQPADTLFWNAVYDAGHAPLFGVVALCTLSLFRILFPKVPPLRLYLAAFATATVIGAFTELAQFYGNRDADLGDLLRNAAGAAAFLTVSRVLDKGPGGRPAIPGRMIRAAATVLAMILLLAPLIPVTVRVVHYRGRDGSFPVLCGFDSGWERTFVQPVSAGLVPELLPAGFGEPEGLQAGRWTFYPRPWPGLALVEPYPDWRAYRTIRFEIWSALERPVGMTLMAEDRHHVPGSGDRARVQFTVEPGRNEISIELEEIRKAPPNRALAMDQVAQVMLYTARPEESFTLWIDSIRLE